MHLGRNLWMHVLKWLARYYADNEPEPQALPDAPRDRADDGPATADRGRRQRTRPDPGQPPRKELY